MNKDTRGDGMYPGEKSFYSQLIFNHDAGPHFVPENMSCAADSGSSAIKLIAFYLPQYHPIPENDEFWGKGFTEWTNVTRAVPRFAGHYQPHLPGPLGFYDLRLPSVLRDQALLARRYGIFGFCFHYYWFDGLRVLDTPLNTLLKNKDIDISFCINWANESWSRKWNGSEEDVLIPQRYSLRSDMGLAEDLVSILQDPRYIYLNDRPVILIYRPALIPDPNATANRLRAHLCAAGFHNPFLVMIHGFDNPDPRCYGMDAAVAFPPLNTPRLAPPNLRETLHKFCDLAVID